MTGPRALHLCIVGGTPRSRGGIEIFCERAAAAAADRDGWRVTALPAQTAWLRPARFATLAHAIRTFVRTVRGGEVDVLWLQFGNLPDLAFLLVASALGVPVLVTPHLGANSRLQHNPVLRRLCCRLLAGADRLALLFDGQDAEIALPRLVPRSTIRTLLPHASLAPPAATDGSNPATADGPAAPLRLLHAARLSEGKGSFRFVALCAELHRRGVPFTAHLVGSADPDTAARIDAAIADAGLGPVLRSLGWLAEAPLLDQLGWADILVHLSTFDSYPLIVLEAMACGTLPIVTDMAGMAAMVRAGDGHVVAADGAVEAAADWLGAQDPALLRRRGLALGATVRASHAWPACMDALAAAIDAMRADRG